MSRVWRVIGSWGLYSSVCLFIHCWVQSLNVLLKGQAQRWGTQLLPSISASYLEFDSFPLPWTEIMIHSKSLWGSGNWPVWARSSSQTYPACPPAATGDSSFPHAANMGQAKQPDIPCVPTDHHWESCCSYPSREKQQHHPYIPVATGGSLGVSTWV